MFSLLNASRFALDVIRDFNLQYSLINFFILCEKQVFKYEMYLHVVRQYYMQTVTLPPT